ncbi:MAG: flagellar biosynthetic protein FliP, partial [Mariprofundales bacterium]|nr:flagellar biosynthetic protein FliP [Mariprofundales bacterium]
MIKAASLIALLLMPHALHAADIPTISLSLGESGDPDEWFNGLKIIAMLTILTLSPSILIMMTSFTRILIVLGFLRQALGTQQSPPAQVLVGLALFMTLFIMMPVWNQIDKSALTPYLNHNISQADAFENAKK